MNIYFLAFLLVFIHSCKGRRNSGSGKSKIIAETIELTATRQKKILTSPGYPGFYLRSYKIEWRISADPTINEAVVNLNFLDFHFPMTLSCYEDRLSIMDGPTMMYSTVKTFCGDTIPSVVTLSGDSATVFLYTNSFDNHYRGFKLEYWADEDTIEFGPVEYTYINYVLIAISLAVIPAGVIALLYLVIRHLTNKGPVYELDFGLNYKKPPLKRKLSHVYEYYYLYYNIKPVEKPKLPPISATGDDTKSDNISVRSLRLPPISECFINNEETSDRRKNRHNKKPHRKKD